MVLRVLHGVTWCYMVLRVLHGVKWCYMVLRVLHGVTWCYMVLHGLCYMVIDRHILRQREWGRVRETSDQRTMTFG